MTGLFFSCNTNTTDPEFVNNASDTDLIQAIKMAADKQSINVEELPSASQNVLEQDYSESYVAEAMIAPLLGYEISMRREKGTRVGERSRAYFDLKGRELRGDKNSDDDGDHHGRDGKDRNECFKLLYPVTYIMPDSSSITGNDKEEIGTAIKSWYEANPDSRERPALQYPVDVIFEDGTTATIANDEEMQSIIAGCKDSDRDEDGEDHWEHDDDDEDDDRD
jgi:hypothetical protein